MRPMKCRFCLKPRADVKKLIASSPTMAICDECIEACNRALASHDGGVTQCEFRRTYKTQRLSGKIGSEAKELLIRRGFTDQEILSGASLSIHDPRLHRLICDSLAVLSLQGPVS